jgi:IS66 Orf2 like protein
MLSFSGSLKVFVAVEACDMRKGFKGHHALVSERWGADLKQGALFVFSNRRLFTALGELVAGPNPTTLPDRSQPAGTPLRPAFAPGRACQGEPLIRRRSPAPLHGLELAGNGPNLARSKWGACSACRGLHPAAK